MQSISLLPPATAAWIRVADRMSHNLPKAALRDWNTSTGKHLWPATGIAAKLIYPGSVRRLYKV